MFKRLKAYLIAIVLLGACSAFIGFAASVVSPYTVAEGVEEAIRGANSPAEVRKRIADYYSSTTLNRLLLLCVPPALVCGIGALALYESVRCSSHSAGDTTP